MMCKYSTSYHNGHKTTNSLCAKSVISALLSFQSRKWERQTCHYGVDMQMITSINLLRLSPDNRRGAFVHDVNLLPFKPNLELLADSFLIEQYYLQTIMLWTVYRAQLGVLYQSQCITTMSPPTTIFS